MAVETEGHVLLDCIDGRLLALRTPFLADATSCLGPIIQNRIHVWPAIRMLDFLLTKDAFIPRLTQFTYDVFTLVEAVPLFQVVDETLYNALP